MKVRLIYETEVLDNEVGEEYDLLLNAVNQLKKDLNAADSVDDLSDVFLNWDGVGFSDEDWIIDKT